MIEIELIHGKLVTAKSKYPGIYAIVNLRNNKFYIGSSNNLYIRKAGHFNPLKRNEHKNPYLQNAFNIDSKFFIMVEIERVSDLSILRDKEQYWMDELNCYNRTIGYNLNRKADSCLGHKHSEETKEKLRKANLGKKMPLEQRLKVSQAGKGRVLSEESKRKISESNRATKLSPEYKAKHIEKATPVAQMDSKGNIIKIWKRIKEAATTLGLQSSNIVHCCKGKRKTTGGFKWAYYNN